jgi:hypothetical protein
MRRAISIILLSMAAGFVGAAAEKPETVMLRFQAKAGAEGELARVIARHWKTAHELKLLRETPHVTLRGTEGGKTYFVDIFTWRDASIPDAAPPAIQAIWAEMNKLVEPRGGRPGIEIAEVSVETAPNQ